MRAALGGGSEPSVPPVMAASSAPSFPHSTPGPGGRCLPVSLVPAAGHKGPRAGALSSERVGGGACVRPPGAARACWVPQVVGTRPSEAGPALYSFLSAFGGAPAGCVSPNDVSLSVLGSAFLLNQHGSS